MYLLVLVVLFIGFLATLVVLRKQAKTMVIEETNQTETETVVSERQILDCIDFWSIIIAILTITSFALIVQNVFHLNI